LRRSSAIGGRLSKRGREAKITLCARRFFSVILEENPGSGTLCEGDKKGGFA